MRQALKYILGGLFLGAIVVGFLYFFGMPRNRATGSPLLLLSFMSIGCLTYGLALPFMNKR